MTTNDSVDVLVSTGKIGQEVRARYSGGPYIELSFTPWDDRVGTEVIDVWDYVKGAPEIGVSAQEVSVEVLRWMRTNEDEGWLDWFDGYVENVRY